MMFGKQRLFRFCVRQAAPPAQSGNGQRQQPGGDLPAQGKLLGALVEEVRLDPDFLHFNAEKVLKQAEGSPQFGMGLPAGEGTGGRIGGIHRQHQPHMADAQ